MFYPKMCFLRMDHHTALKLVPLWLACLKTSGLHGVWSSKYKEKWCFIPKCVLSETDHHTALKLVPLWLACLKTSVYTKRSVFYPKICFVRNRWNFVIGMPLNGVWPSKTKRSDVLSQNVFCQKQIIIQLWNLYHCDWHAWKPQGAWSLVL